MKKKILFGYTFMMIGGSTTSLISILQNIDYSKYEVDLLLMKKGYPLDFMIPEQVNVLEPALNYKSKKDELWAKILNPVAAVNLLKSRIVPRILKKYHSGAVKSQIVNKVNAALSRRLDKEYDCAISFIESWPTEYIAHFVKAKRKITWYHLDYIAAGFYPKYDRNTYSKFDKIVLVSDQCKENFDSVFPEYATRTTAVENILTTGYINEMKNAYEQDQIVVSTDRINLVTTCRIVFKHKGLDRGIKMLRKVLDDVHPRKEVHWYIIGDGEDYVNLEKMIVSEGLENNVHLLGVMNNPLPYVKAADLYFLPSRFEGKPMAVTEALMCGVPVLVTNYASAGKQITSGVDGLVVENSEIGIYKGLRELIEDDSRISVLKATVVDKDYSNLYELRKVEKIIDE